MPILERDVTHLAHILSKWYAFMFLLLYALYMYMYMKTRPDARQDSSPELACQLNKK